MKFHIMTLFPEMVAFGLNQSILKRAKDQAIIDIEVVNIRDYAFNKHKQVDDYPYGGGAGMLMQAEPIVLAYEEIVQKSKTRPKVLYMSPQGEVFTQGLAKELAKEEELIFLCGHYEGVDERALQILEARSISIGDYVLTGGELPAMVMVDAISRMVGGVLSNDESADFESFEDGLLEYPQYTRPKEFRGMEVPDIMLSGHHKNIERWRRKESLRRTLLRRPDLLENAHLNENDEKLLREIHEEMQQDK